MEEKQFQTILTAITLIEERIGKLEKTPRQSGNIREVSEALREFQAICPILQRTKRVKVNNNYEFTYCPYEDGIAQIQPFLSECGLSYSHTLEYMQVGGNDMLHCVTTVLHGASGQFLSLPVPIQSTNKLQDLGSSMTYAKRYGLFSLLGVGAEEDDDGNSASGNEINKAERVEQAIITEDQYKELRKTIEAICKGSDESADDYEAKLASHLKVETLKKLQAVRFNNILVNLKGKLKEGDEK